MFVRETTAVSKSSGVALVTGSATGIGRAAVLSFARRGYAVAVNYSRSEAEAHETAELARKIGVKALVHKATVADDAAVNEMVDRCVAELGRIDVLVNNAGTTHFVKHTDLDALTEAMWDEILAVNLKGTFFVSRAVIKVMQRQGTGGSIVNVSSVAGVKGGGSSIAYCASKAGMLTLTKDLARAFGPEIRVNAVCPGPVLTRWLGPHLDHLEKFLVNAPLKKASTPEDIANAIEYLALDAPTTTGQDLIIDAGRTM